MLKIDPKKIEDCFNTLMKEGLGLDLSDPNLIGTPKRVAKMYAEMFSGLYTPISAMTTFPNESKYDEIVMMDNITFTSVCSHHFLPFTGKAWVAYIPGKTVLGASKASRIINHYAHRPQLQEALCDEVSNHLWKALQPKGVAVVMRAIHGCMSCRGIRQYDNSGMVTSSLQGVFKDDDKAKQELFNLISLSERSV